MSTVESLTSPAVLVDRARLRANVRRMQERAGEQDVRLRPHVKTHKSPAIGRLQREEGASGITVATVSEAEAFAEAGFEDIRIASPLVQAAKHRRIRALAAKISVSFTVDGEENLRRASEAHEEAPAAVLLEIDTGQHRCGVRWDRREEIVRLARLAGELPGVRLEGILTHAGQVYGGPRENESRAESLERHAREERDRMLKVARVLADAGLAEPGSLEISVGSTPTASRFENRSEDGFSVTEIRPGNYVFNDGMQVVLGSATLDQCALTVLATVVSATRTGSRERVILDAGKKVLTTDTGYGTEGYGTILYNAATMRPHPHARIERLSEEHAWVGVPGGSTLHVGDPVRILPHHACVTAATQDEIYLLDREEQQGEVEPVPVTARAHRPRS